jgi:oligopeptide/dipeptide ABC transporter ATP-binding protein
VTTLLEVRNLVKEFHVGRKVVVHAVNDVSFSLARGETLGIVGESGSGKTTVGRCILRTVEATSGDIVFEGQDVLAMHEKRFRRLRRDIQMVFQDPFDSLDPRMTVADIVREPLRAQARGVRRRGSDAEVARIADRVAIPRDWLHRFPRELSAGQQQRVGVARAVATNPKLVVLDEAVSNLDPSARFEIIELLKELQLELGLSFIFISHDLNTVRYVSDRVAVMYLGKIVEYGPTQQLFERQLHPYSRALLSSVLFPDPLQPRPAYQLAGEIPSPTQLPRGCFLASRCPDARPACELAYPPMIAAAADRAASCFLLDDTTFPSAEVDVPDQLMSRR